MLRVLKDNGMIVMGDLMFESSEERANIEDTLSKEQVEEVEDEYFSNIEYLEEVLKERGKNLKKTRIDMVNWIIEIR